MVKKKNKAGRARPTGSTCEFFRHGGYSYEPVICLSGIWNSRVPRELESPALAEAKKDDESKTAGTSLAVVAGTVLLAGAIAMPFISLGGSAAAEATSVGLGGDAVGLDTLNTLEEPPSSAEVENVNDLKAEENKDFEEPGVEADDGIEAEV